MQQPTIRIHERQIHIHKHVGIFHGGTLLEALASGQATRGLRVRNRNAKETSPSRLCVLSFLCG